MRFDLVLVDSVSLIGSTPYREKCAPVPASSDKNQCSYSRWHDRCLLIAVRLHSAGQVHLKDQKMIQPRLPQLEQPAIVLIWVSCYLRFLRKTDNKQTDVLEGIGLQCVSAVSAHCTEAHAKYFELPLLLPSSH